MLPFLKDEAIAQGPEEVKDFGTLDAIGEDMLSAFKSGDISRLRAALESLCEYVRSEDSEQDKSLTNKE